ncbi:MAG TPA: transcriptional regulator [Jatrophihabitantaceae bacterium]
MEAERPSIAAVAALDDEVRHALYRCVRDARRPITREQAAAEVGISRKLAAFHLDKLVTVGLLRARYHSGGRIGRAPKVYELSGDDVSVCLPARRPALLAEILLGAVLTTGGSERPDRAAHRVARDYGERLGAAERERVRPGRLGAERALALAGSVCERYGFEPGPSESGAVRLRNCPFHPLAARAPELVCGVNQQFLSGLLNGLGARGVDAVLEPSPGECCVELRRSAAP